MQTHTRRRCHRRWYVFIKCRVAVANAAAVAACVSRCSSFCFITNAFLCCPFPHFNCLAAGTYSVACERWPRRYENYDTHIHTQFLVEGNNGSSSQFFGHAHIDKNNSNSTSNSNGLCTRQRVIETPACQRCVRCVKIDMRVDSLDENEQRMTVRMCECVWMNYVHGVCANFLLFWSSQVFLSEALHASIHFISFGTC